MAQDLKLEQLKQKYQPAIDAMKSAGVHLTHVHVQDGKLFIQGEAPSQDVKNRVWDQIKRIDPSYSDLTCDLTVNAQEAYTSAATGTNVGQPGGSMQTYTVQPGDTLSAISKKVYGNANQYMRIFEANRDQLQNPDRIQAGQKLKIPAASV